MKLDVLQNCLPVIVPSCKWIIQAFKLHLAFSNQVYTWVLLYALMEQDLVCVEPLFPEHREKLQLLSDSKSLQQGYVRIDEALKPLSIAPE